MKKQNARGKDRPPPAAAMGQPLHPAPHIAYTQSRWERAVFWPRELTRPPEQLAHGAGPQGKMPSRSGRDSQKCASSGAAGAAAAGAGRAPRTSTGHQGLKRGEAGSGGQRRRGSPQGTAALPGPRGPLRAPRPRHPARPGAGGAGAPCRCRDKARGGGRGEEIAAALRRPREPTTPPAPPLGTGGEAIPVLPRVPHLQRAAPRSGPSSRPAAAQPGRRSGEGRARHMRAARRSGAAPETLGAASAGAQLAGESHGSGVALRGATRGGTLGAGHTRRGRTGGCSSLCSPEGPRGGWDSSGAGQGPRGPWSWALEEP